MLLLTLLLILPYGRADQYDHNGIVSFPNEVHLSNIRQLTFGGENAEGYFSYDDSKLTLQATYPWSTTCDQIYQLDLTKDPRTTPVKRMSTGLGSTTCSFFLKDDEHFLYAGTFHHVNYTQQLPTDGFNTCNPKKCPDDITTITDPVLRDLCNTTYTWDIFPEYDIFIADGYGNIQSRLTNTWGYDAEGVVNPDGTLIAFTSLRSGDLELWIMNVDGSNPRQITNALGYDGGSFFSPDGQWLIFRASRPNTTAEIAKYKALLEYGLVAPTQMELFKIRIDGTEMTQLTHIGGANWAPYYTPDQSRVIFSSDYGSKGGCFNLFLINDDGTGSGFERVTQGDNQFESFPMFSRNGKQLVWGSSRNGSTDEELNLFIADWIDDPSAETTSNHERLFNYFYRLLTKLF